MREFVRHAVPWMLAVVIMFLVTSAFGQIPSAASQYRLPLTAAAQATFGPMAPVAMFAAQIHQESGWQPSARSAYAIGLTQFTPATAAWMAGQFPSLYPVQLTSASWAIRAQVAYMGWLRDRITARNDCERWAFTLSAYNGGLGWVNARKAMSQRPDVCLYATCRLRPKGVSLVAQAENEVYPLRIIEDVQPRYRSWGGTVCH